MSTKTPPDWAELRKKVLNGDMDAAKGMADMVAAMGFAFFLRCGQPPADAEALAVTSVTEIFLVLDKFRGGWFRAWAYEIMLNQLRNTFRRRLACVPLKSAHLNLSQLNVEEDPACNGSHYIRAVQDALNTLPEAKRMLMENLLGRERIPWTSLAKELGITDRAVRVRVHRAKKNLEAKLRDDPRMKSFLENLDGAA